MLFSVSLLHSDYIETESVLSSDFMTRWEMIYLLVFVKALVEVTFATTRAPKNIPLMAFGWGKVGTF
jgi:hypothetical protein